MPLVTAIATVLTNVITQAAKPAKKANMTPSEKKKRKRGVRMFSALISVVSVVGTSMILGEAVPTESLTTALESLLTAAVAFFGAQGTYFLSTRK